MKANQAPAWTHQLTALALLAVAALLPLAMGLTLSDHVSPHITNSRLLDTALLFDIFMGIKFKLLLVGTAIILVLMGIRSAGKEQLQPSEFHPPLLVLVGAVLLSVLFSPYKTIAVIGFPKETYLGTLTFLADLALFFAALHAARSKGFDRAFLFALAPFVLVNLLTTTLSFYGVELMESEGIRTFFYPPDKVTLDTYGQLFTTLGNPNYSSGLGGSLAAMFLAGSLLIKEQRQQIAALALAAASWAITLASLATSGFLAFVAALPLVALAAYRLGDRARVRRIALAALAAFALIFGTFYLRNPQVWEETFGFAGQFFRQAPAATAAPAPAAQPQTPAGEFRIPQLPEFRWSAGTGRAYTWRETLKLIARRPLFGWGLDTIAYTFPQNDPAGGQAQLVVKPHNMYLGLAYGSGLIALLAFGALLLLMLRKAWLYLKDTSRASPAVISLMIGWAAFLVQGLFNDAMLGMSTFFWITFGVAIAQIEGTPHAVAPAAPPVRKTKKAR